MSSAKLKATNNDSNNNNIESIEKLNWWIIFIAVLALTAFTRFYKVTEPDHICWDETHFGKMGSWYINRTFFFDVHPPLGKMLIALSGYLTGYNGSYPFDKPGDKYNGTRYEGMRIFCTTLGALVVPMVFDMVWDLTNSKEAAIMSSAYIIFDVGLLTLNQYILLDPILLFFMAGSVWAMVKVSKSTNNNQSFTFKWWLWLFVTGTMISCTMSVKFVGLFVILLVGFHTIHELWIMLGDLYKPMTEICKQLFCRSIALIIWPILLYVLFFYIHLAILNKSGNGDGFYSSAFQSRLVGNSLFNATMPRKIGYGSFVTIKNHKAGGGYLHSHYHLYPKGVGSRQQQITSYTHKDENNIWIVKPHIKESYPDVRIVKHGDLIRLEHVATKRNLHSHKELAPVTKKHYQVTGYGEKGVGDVNDIWRILIPGGKDTDEVLTISTKFRLIHYVKNCALMASGQQLPKWGFEQQEVSCSLNIRDRNTKWNFEDNVNKNLPSVNFQVYAPGFIERFFESHAVMFQGNSGLKPKEGEVTSRPWQWPLNYRGQFFSGTTYRIYLLGNPIIWWSNLIFLILFLIVYLITAIKERRNLSKETLRASLNKNGKLSSSKLQMDINEIKMKSCKNDPVPNKKKLLHGASWLFIGWLLHYLPFWAMGRVLYFHHYFPALIFNSMLTGIMLHYLTNRLSKWLQHIILGNILAILAYSFIIFSPLSYGMSGAFSTDPNSTMYGLKWMQTWEF